MPRPRRSAAVNIGPKCTGPATLCVAKARMLPCVSAVETDSATKTVIGVSYRAIPVSITQASCPCAWHKRAIAGSSSG